MAGKSVVVEGETVVVLTVAVVVFVVCAAEVAPVKLELEYVCTVVVCGVVVFVKFAFVVGTVVKLVVSVQSSTVVFGAENCVV